MPHWAKGEDTARRPDRGRQFMQISTFVLFWAHAGRNFGDAALYCESAAVRQDKEARGYLSRKTKLR